MVIASVIEQTRRVGLPFELTSVSVAPAGALDNQTDRASNAGSRRNAHGRSGIAAAGGNGMSAPDTIVLVHGFWVTPRSWEHWIAHYESKGYRVIAPAYPGFE